MLGFLKPCVRMVSRSLWHKSSPPPSLSYSMRAFSAQPSPTESFLNGTSTPYVEAMFEQWSQDPQSVHPSWRTFFELENKGFGKGLSYTPPPGMNKATPLPQVASSMSLDDIQAHVKVERLIRAYEVRGHNIATLDPLGIMDADLSSEVPPELKLEYYQFSENDLDREIVLAPRPIFNGASSMKLKDIISSLQHVYCSNIGFEFMFIQERERVLWLQERIRNSQEHPSSETRKAILKDLIHASGFEDFLKRKYVSEKRFGLEGCESLIAGMKSMLTTAFDDGVEYTVLGMPHRGRLNILHNVMQKRGEVIFNEFASRLDSDDEGSGDVKYHLGMSSDITFPGREGKMHLSLMANPSHLEAVNPVVEGKTRAEQEFRNDIERKRVVPILLHGDAAFAGQGVVYETIGLAALPAYTTGGTLHIIVNNQIGFTTDPRVSRSSPYCTDVAKMVGAPIFHVNGDDPEAVVRCCNLAMEWRQKYGTDVVVDIVCYRRHGHNEADQPAFTQPLMYQRIGKQPSVTSTYTKQLLEEGVVDQDWVKNVAAEYESRLSSAFDNAPNFVDKKPEYLGSYWSKFLRRIDLAKPFDTGFDTEKLKHIGKVSSEFPEDLTVHRSLEKVLATRKQAIESGEGIDWAAAESLAFGSLLLENYPVRLSGQDVERGTFSQRHHILHDQKHDKVTYQPLSHLSSAQAQYTVSNSHLSEYAVLGFELGYSQAHPDQLVCWEAQFGDFHNTAQCIIDQFIAAGEHKWKRQSGLVMLLPHGYEGMGPEHSSARLERFLQLANDDESVYPEMSRDARKQIQQCNIQVLNCSTPANYFHALRRQVHRTFRKPLVVMTPKSLLRHPLCKSTLDEFGPGTRFRRLIPEHDKSILQDPSDVKRLVLCSGKVYYDLLQYREVKGIRDVAIGRIEQISPFPFDLVHRHADDFPNAEIVWCQEEPKNMGAWSYVQPRIETALSKSTHHSSQRSRYIGRGPNASVATGDKKIHQQEQVNLVEKALL